MKNPNASTCGLKAKYLEIDNESFESLRNGLILIDELTLPHPYDTEKHQRAAIYGTLVFDDAANIKRLTGYLIHNSPRLYSSSDYDTALKITASLSKK